MMHGTAGLRREALGCLATELLHMLYAAVTVIQQPPRTGQAVQMDHTLLQKYKQVL